MEKKLKNITIIMSLLLIISVIIERYFLNFDYKLMFKTIGVFIVIALVIRTFFKQVGILRLFSYISVSSILIGMIMVFYLKVTSCILYVVGSFFIELINDLFELNISFFDMSNGVSNLLEFSNIFVPCYCLSVLFLLALSIFLAESAKR